MPKDTKVPNSWEQKSQTTKIVRYWSDGISRKMGQLARALEAKSTLMNAMFYRTQTEFDEYSDKWSKAVVGAPCSASFCSIAAGFCS